MLVEFFNAVILMNIRDISVFCGARALPVVLVFGQNLTCIAFLQGFSRNYKS